MRTWNEITARAGRNDYPYLIFTNWRDLLERERPTALIEAWRMAEFPESLAPTSLWIMALDEVGYTVDGEVMERADDPHLPDPVTLWRGCTPARRDGLAWTLDRDRAIWFANRFDGLRSGATRVYEITIPHTYALARITTRGEDEVVVDTSTFEDDEYTVLRSRSLSRKSIYLPPPYRGRGDRDR